MNKMIPIVAIAATSVLGSSAAAGDVTEELEACGAIDDANERLVCYDKLSGWTGAGEGAEAARNEAALGQLAAERVTNKDKEEQPEIRVRAHVVRCEKSGVAGRYLFYFDNGQVWKQKSERRLSFDDCDFYITITKDFFGYKMQRDGDKGRVRIARIK